MPLGRSGLKAELLAGLDVESANGEHIEHLPSVVSCLAATVKVAEGFPQSLALELPLLQPLGDFYGVSSNASGPGRSTASGRFNLLDKAFVLLVEHADVSLEPVSLALHVSVDLSPFVLLLAGNRVLLGDEMSHLVALLKQITLFFLELATQSTTFVLERFRRQRALDPALELSGKLSDSVPHEVVFVLESIVLARHQAFVVRVGAGQVALVLETHVQAADCVLLRLNLAAVVLHHSVALVLKTFVLSLSLHQLPLQLFKLLVTGASSLEGLGKVSVHRVAVEGRLQG